MCSKGCLSQKKSGYKSALSLSKSDKESFLFKKRSAGKLTRSQQSSQWILCY